MESIRLHHNEISHLEVAGLAFRNAVMQDGIVARPKTYDDELRNTLIRIAAESIADGGERHMSLRPVTDAARTSTTAVYSFFGNKEGLVIAVLQEAQESFAHRQASVPVTDDPIEDLANLGLAYRDWVRENPSLYQVMFGGTVEATRNLKVNGWQLYDAAVQPLRTQVQRLYDAGLIEGVPVDLVVESIWAAVHGFISLENALWHDDPRADSPDRFVAHCRSMLRGWLTLSQDPGAAPIRNADSPAGVGSRG